MEKLAMALKKLRSFIIPRFYRVSGGTIIFWLGCEFYI